MSKGIKPPKTTTYGYGNKHQEDVQVWLKLESCRQKEGAKRENAHEVVMIALIPCQIPGGLPTFLSGVRRDVATRLNPRIPDCERRGDDIADVRLVSIVPLRVGRLVKVGASPATGAGCCSTVCVLAAGSSKAIALGDVAREDQANQARWALEP
jgi:hypothetical protein